MSAEKQKDGSLGAPTSKDLKAVKWIFWRSVFHSVLVGSALTAVWLFGSTGYFWPMWVWLGLALAAVLRAGDAGLCAHVARLQNWVTRVLGDFESRQIKRLEAWSDRLCTAGCPFSKKEEGSKDLPKTAAPQKSSPKSVKKRAGTKVPRKKVVRKPKKGSS